jgi:hypothetical protein
MRTLNCSNLHIVKSADVLSCVADGEKVGDMLWLRICLVATALIGSMAGLARAADDADSLSKQLANPVANLISVPFQENILFGLGPDGDGTASVLNIQPVIPFHLNEDWNLISRTILPVVYTSKIFEDDFGGLADTTQSFFLSPSKPTSGGLVWGVGPVINIPTATDPRLGTSEWGAGPTAVALVQKGPWTVGTLANQVWSFGDGDINQTFVQPFATYSLGKGRSVNLNTQTTYNWNSEEWTIPITLTAQQVFKLGKQPMQFQIGGTYYADKPQDGPDWGIRTSLVFLFPTRK